KLKALRSDRRIDDLDRALERLPDIGRVRLEAQGATDDAGHVEEVFEDGRLRVRAALQGAQGLVRLRRVEAAGLQKPDPPQYAGRRRPQFVRQGRQKLVFEPVGGGGGRRGGALAIEQRLALAVRCLSLTDVAEGSDRANGRAAMIADG